MYFLKLGSLYLTNMGGWSERQGDAMRVRPVGVLTPETDIHGVRAVKVRPNHNAPAVSTSESSDPRD